MAISKIGQLSDQGRFLQRSAKKSGILWTINNAHLAVDYDDILCIIFATRACNSDRRPAEVDAVARPGVYTFATSIYPRDPRWRLSGALCTPDR